MSHVPQVIAETASDRQRQKFSTVEAEAEPTSPSFWSIDYDRVDACPTKSCFSPFDIAQFRL